MGEAEGRCRKQGNEDIGINPESYYRIFREGGWVKGLTYSQFVADQIYHKRGRYRYSREGFGTCHSKINIFCFKHGWFEQIRKTHDTGCSASRGCRECGALLHGRKRRKEVELLKEFKAKNLNIVEFNRVSKELSVRYLCTCGKYHYRLVGNIRRSSYKCPGTPLPKGGYKRPATTYNTLSHEIAWLLFAEQDCELLSIYQKASIPLDFICKCGRKGRKLLHNFKRHPWCAFCGKQKIQEKRITPNYIGLSSFKTYGKKLESLGDTVREGPDGEVQIRCYYSNCRKWHKATKHQVHNRLRNAETLGDGETNIYCSIDCTTKCPVYGFNPDTMIDKHSKLFTPKNKTERTRACGKISRRELLRIQIDETGHIYCEKCGKETTKIELHHTQEVRNSGSSAITSAGHVLLCEECHKKFTLMCRN
jgi:hypothetical protein